MKLFGKFRKTDDLTFAAENAEVKRILRKGPNDTPAGIRHNHNLLKSVGGW